MNLDIAFIPETPEDLYEAAKLQVIALLDRNDWKWLRARINDEYLCWHEIFQLVADAS